ncbi:Iron-containing redox enzyme [Variovorax sp. HW608]|uniref:iron-containing redox enzyme family protein n=1 Tax=Variovorax sp. HW608 TaxID=1034889 RepID=UPI00081FC15D|nr:iron-containing redox enzyme family protein [Variovorax sp. HW608]SCK23146.1 Iron-containing redox enzyme [Variovorax sp. HW608]
MQQFWKLADSSKTEAEFIADRKLKELQTLPIESLRKIFVQYRYFTIYYIADMALLVHRLPFGKLRSLLAEFLSEELGDGSPTHAHPDLYDSFLASVGVDARGCQPIPSNVKLLEGISSLMETESSTQGVGLRGLGGECLCQLYLSAMYSHFSRNPAIEAMSDRVDWRFWRIHIGDVDIQHRLKLRAAIDEEIARSPECEDEIRIGYEKSKAAWDQFWTNIFEAEMVMDA